MHEDDGISGGAALKQSRHVRRPTCATQGSDEYIYKNARSGASRITVFTAVEFTKVSKFACADTKGSHGFAAVTYPVVY